MAVKTDSPQIIALRQTVEKRFGHPIEGRSDFSLLAMEIERITHEHIAENTLRRLWRKISGYDTVFTRTLDVLCRYVGCEHWNAFVVSLHKQSSRESDLISDGTSIKVEDLTPGDRIRIGWLPDRVCIIEYVGGRMFKAVDTRNSTLQVGDTFECSVMLKNYPLLQQKKAAAQTSLPGILINASQFHVLDSALVSLRQSYYTICIIKIL